MKTFVHPAQNTWPLLIKRPAVKTMAQPREVEAILDNVKKKGDRALLQYTRQWDAPLLRNIRVEKNELSDAGKQVPTALKKAIQTAAKNITAFHRAQLEKTLRVQTMPGISCWRKQVPIQNVGLYVPGGSAPLFSTVLMLGIPAKLAGCTNIVLCSPPGKNGRISSAVLYTAHLLGITQVFAAGGAQAIAAMAYGTESIPQVSKIFGPGNTYVTMAKQLVSARGVAIDMPAGPSELAILADHTCVPAFVAADLLSQAEHGPDSQVMLVTTSKKTAQQVEREIYKQLDLLPRKNTARKALRNSRAIVVKNTSQAMDLLNLYAPEHLILACNKAAALAGEVRNAGSVFVGHYACESAGDYASGTNHTLPTNGFAAAYSGVSLNSFCKYITFQQITRKGLAGIAPVIETMAEAEGLMAHKNAVSIRWKKQ